ncbi:MAG: hypothetical protein WBL46_03155 [Nitrososphaeraceae archaeon]
MKVAVNKTSFERYCGWLLNNVKGRRKFLTSPAKEEILKFNNESGEG